MSSSPSKRETRIPTPSPKSTSPKKRFSPTNNSTTPLAKTWTSGKKQLTPRSGSGLASSSRPHTRHPYQSRPSPDPLADDADCLDASLDILKSETEAYEYLFEEVNNNDDGGNQMNRANDGKSSPWMSVINKLYEKHSEEKTQWKKTLTSAKQKSRQYKEELRDNLTERLKFLESKVMDPDGPLSRAGSGATQGTQTTQDGTASSEGTSSFLPTSSSSPTKQQQQHLKRTPSDEAENVEVIYEELSDTSVRKQVELLEQRLQQASLSHTFEKEHWLATLDEAEIATQNGADLSRRVQGILEQVATEWQDVRDEELLTANAAIERLKQRLLDEQQAHEDEKAHWQNEAVKLKDDSRRLLKERNDYKSKLNRHRDELEKSKATLTELERKVDLCQRQASLAQKKANQWQEKAAEKGSNQQQQRGHQNRQQDPPSPDRPESLLQSQLKRAMEERDAALQEAEQTCSMLEDYQNRLEKDRTSYNQKLKKVEEKYEEELKKRMAEYKIEFADKFKNWPLSDVPPAELERRYRESVEKRNELASRMRQVQEQLSSEKGEWKLKLEATLSDNRRLNKENEHLKTQLQSLGDDQASARANWENRLEQASKEWVERLSEIQQEHQSEKDDLEQSMKNLREYKENAETLATETTRQLDKLKEKHRQDVLEWKEREVRTSQKTLFEAKEQFAVDIQALHKEIARLEKENASIEKLQKEIEEGKNSAKEFRDYHDKVVSEWEQFANKRQTEVQELETKVKASDEKIKELELALDEFLDEHEQANAIHEKFTEQHDLAKSTWEQERSNLDRQLQELRTEVESARVVNEQLEAKVKEKDGNCEILQKQIDDWKQQVDQANQNRETLQNQISEWRKAAAEAVSTRDGALRELDAVNEQLSNDNALREELQEENEKLHTSSEDLQTELTSWKDRSRILEADLASWKAQSDGLEAELTSWKEKAEALMVGVGPWKEKSERLEGDIARQGTEVGLWKEKFLKLEGELARAVKAREDESRQAVHRVESLEEENEGLRCQLDGQAAELEQWIEKAANTDSFWKSKFDTVEQEKRELEDLRDSQRQQLADWTSKVEGLESSWKRRIDQVRFDLKKSESAKDDQREEARQLKKVLEEEREIWARDGEDLRAERAELEKSRDEQIAKFKEMENQTKQLKTQHENKLSKLKRLYDGRMQEMEELNAKMTSTCDEKDDEIAQLRLRVSEIDQAIGLNGRSLAEMKALHVGELQELKARLESTRRECDTKLAQAQASFETEINEWKGKATEAKEDFRKQLDNARSDHVEESRTLQDKLAKAEEEISSFAQQTNKLTTSLDQLQSAHEDAKRHWQGEVERIRGEKERLEESLRNQDKRQQHQNAWRAHTSSLQQHQHSISSLVEGIRGEVKSVKNLVQTSIDQSEGSSKATLGSLRGDLESIRGTLEETLSRMSNETAALLDHRDQLMALTEASARADEAHRRFFEQQERLVSEMQLLRNQVAENNARRDNEETSMILDKARVEFVEELHRKETELAKNAAEINRLREELESEKEMREKAEKEILTLNDQADAYGEELMRLQGVTKDLEDTMQDIDNVKSSHMETVVFNANADDTQSIASDQSSPMLDEALALAQSLTEMVHGSGSNEQETSVMTMLENLSDMMDQHDRGRATKSQRPRRKGGSVPSEVSVAHKSKRKLYTRVEGEGDGQLETVLFPDDEEPLPVTSPPNRGFFSQEAPSHIQLVVDQLYARCQLLERERTQMMESTLELLQAARDANEAELSAALSTSRRRSAEELLKVQEESQQGMWRMYNKLCSFCRDDLVLEEEKKEIM